MTKHLLWFILASFAGLFLSLTAQADDIDFFAEINATHQESTSIRMDFRQSSVSQLFKKPLISTGRITLQRPGKLRWEYTTPAQSGFILDGATGIQWSSVGTAISLKTTPLSPVLQVIGQQMLLWLSADKEQLSNDFTVDVKNGQCVLTPLNPVMQEYIHTITLSLEKGQEFIQNIVVQEPSGNTTQISLAHPEVNPVLDSTVFTAP